MTPYAFSTPARMVFGRGCRAGAAAEIAAFGGPVLLVHSRSVPWAQVLAAELSAAGLVVQSMAASGEPVLDDLRAALGVARGMQPACIVAVGGGAVIDLGKAVAGLCRSEGDPADYLDLGDGSARPIEDPLPFVAVPSTAGTGAEATRNAVIGIPERQMKISLRDARLLPALAIVDPALTDGLPRAVTLATGLDAVTQLVESYLSNRATPLTDALCRDAIGPAVAALRRLMDADDPDARDVMARASHLSGLALANSGLGVVHGLAAVIGAKGGAHGAICGRLLAAALVVNRQVLAGEGGATDRFDAVDTWLRDGLGSGSGSGTDALRRFTDAHGLPGLEALHCPPEDFEDVAARALTASSTRANGAVLEVADVRRILTLAG